MFNIQSIFIVGGGGKAPFIFSKQAAVFCNGGAA